MSTTTPTPAKKRSVWSRLYQGETNVDFIGRWKLWFALSGVVILVGLVALGTKGLNLGIDFTGGTVWTVPAGDAKVAEVEDAMANLGYTDVQVQEITQNSGEGQGRFLRVVAEANAEPAAATTKALDELDGNLADLRKDVPAAARGDVDAVRDDLDGIDGPFRTAVPAPIGDIQAEIDRLPATLKKAKDDVAATKRATTRMQVSVSELSDLEQAERVRSGLSVSKELASLTGSKIQVVTVDTVGPSWGQQISEKARNALVVFLLAITLYITLRFEFRMALATLAALVHDLVIVVGLYAIFGLPVTPATVIALLTILGFSIYDGIVVFDRVDENKRLVGRKSRMTYSEMANLSLNQVLMRSLNTSITALLPIISVLLVGSLALGATTLEEFGLALFLGLLSGAYSSIFIATPLLAILKEREPRYRQVRDGIAEIRAAEAKGGQPAMAMAGGDGGEAVGRQIAPGANPVAPGSAPRPRKPGKR